MRRTPLIWMLLTMLLTTAAMAQDPPKAAVRFAWAQPQTTITGQPMADGWMKEYRIFVGTDIDTTYFGRIDAPAALADSCVAFISLEIGVPSFVQVEGVNRWDVAGPLRSQWSDTIIVIPDPQAPPGTPQARR